MTTPTSPLRDAIQQARYTQAWSQLSFHQAGTRASFTVFIQLATAIVGGSIWLCTQRKWPATVAHDLARLSNILLIGVAALAIVKIGSHMRGWWRWRNFIAKLHVEDFGLVDGGPRKSALGFDIALIVAIVLLIAGFALYNPFVVVNR